MPSEPRPAETRDHPSEPAASWAALEQLLTRCDADGALTHAVAPLAAFFLGKNGLPVPPALERARHRTALRMLTVPPLLEHVRAACDGPLVLMKGPEIALHYPGTARFFSDVDLLVEEPRSVHGQLQASGFVETGDPALFHGIHHLRPLRHPALPLEVEIHKAPKWPEGLPAPPADEIIAAAVPSALGVDGILAADPAHHALLVAAHAWAHGPLLHLRDLVDVRALGLASEKSAIESAARDWRLLRLWRTMDRAMSALLGERAPTTPLRLWARHLADFRERTVLENHLQQWLSGYWALPARPALAASRRAILRNVRPAHDENWREKLDRTVKAARNAGSAVSNHNLLLGDAATRGRLRNPPDDE